MLVTLSGTRKVALGSGRMNEPITVETYKGSTVTVVSVPLDGDGEDAARRRR